MSTFSQKILGKIKKENITPLPRALFLAREMALWMLFILAIFAGGAALSVLFVVGNNFSLEIFQDDRISKEEFLLTILPLSWIALLAIFLLGASAAAHYTRRGYRFSLWRLIAFNIAGSLILALLFVFSGGEKKVKNVVQEISFFQNHERHARCMWAAPEKGRLAGEVKKVFSKENVLLRDSFGREWLLFVEQKNIPPHLFFVGNHIRLLGTQTGEKKFFVEKAFPFRNPPPQTEAIEKCFPVIEMRKKMQNTFFNHSPRLPPPHFSNTKEMGK